MIFKWLSLTVLLLSGAFPVASQSFKYLNQAPYPEVRTQILSFDFDSASVLLKQKSKNPESEAIRQYYRFLITAWKYVLSESPESYKKFADTESEIEDLLEEFEDQAEFKFLLGELYFWKTIVEFRNGSVISAVYNGNKAYSHYEDADEKQPNNRDIKKGIGLAHFMVGTVPKKYSWITGVFGFSGTMDQGLQELSDAANSNYSQDESRFFLSAIKLFVFRDSKGCLDLLNPLMTKYPNNGLFILTAGIAYQRDRKMETAKNLYENKLDYFDRNLPAFSDLIRLRLGECQFFLNRTEASEQTLKAFIKNYKGEALKPIALYRLGIAQEILGKHQEAVQHFHKIVPRDNFEFEQFAKIESEKYIDKPMSENEKILWKAKNYFDSGEIEKAIEISEDMIQRNISDIETKGEFYYRLGRMYEEKENYKKSLYYYDLASKIPFKLYSWLGAYTWYQTGKVHAKLNNMKDARIAFDKAANYPAHVFENSLSREIDTELKKMETPEKK